MLFKIVSPLIFALGLYFLVKLIGRMSSMFGGKKFEFPVSADAFSMPLKDAGLYEIAVRRPGFLGQIPTNIRFELEAPTAGSPIEIRPTGSIFSARKDMSGRRSVPMAEFTISQSGGYTVRCNDYNSLKSDDKIIISSKTGDNVVLLILGLILSGGAAITGLIFSILAFSGRL